MATLPADRTKLALAQSNQNPSNVLGSSQNKNAITEAYDTIDLLYGNMTGLISAAQLSKLGIINVMDYNASGSNQTTTGSITTGTSILTLAAALDFKNGQGINVNGKAEVDSLQITSSATVSNNVTVTLNGVAFLVAVLAGDTIAQVATKIRAATYAGWTTGGVAGSDTITFTSTTTGTRTTPTYSAGTTTAAGTMTVNTLGTADFITTISSGAGTNILTLSASATTTVSSVVVAHDDTAAIQAAIDTASIGTGTGYVRIPAGNYTINSPININKQVTIVGVIGKTVIWNKGTGHAIVNNTDNQCVIEGVNVQGSMSSGSGLFLSGGAAKATDCIFGSHGRYGIEFGNTNHIVSSQFTKCIIGSNRLGGVYSTSISTSQKNLVTFKDCYVVSNGKNADGSDPTDATPTWGHGFYIEGGIAWSLIGCVSEVNSGAGIYIKALSSYGVYGINVIGCHLESSKYANIYVNPLSGSFMTDVNIEGNYYVSGVTNYPSSILSRGVRTIVDNFSLISYASIDKTFDLTALKTQFNSHKQSLKLGGELEVVNPGSPFIKGITSSEPLANGYNCIRIDSVIGNQQEVVDYVTFVDPRFSYRLVVDYRYNKTTSTGATISFNQLDMNKTTLGGSIAFSFASGDTWYMQDLIINASQMNANTRYLQLNLAINGTVSAAEYLLIRKVLLHRLDGVVTMSGLTAARPPFPIKGESYLDMTLNAGAGMYIIYNGANWINPSTGVTV